VRSREQRDSGERDLFRTRLDQIIDMDHALAEARAGDRLAVPGGQVRCGLHRQAGTTAAALAEKGSANKKFKTSGMTDDVEGRIGIISDNAHVGH
jgi:hypothetical protein